MWKKEENRGVRAWICEKWAELIDEKVLKDKGENVSMVNGETTNK